jgi:hypothetical protein
MSDYQDEITLSKPVAEMMTIAGEYSNYMDTVEEKSRNGILEFTVRVLPLLYLKGTMLPEVDVEFPEANERFVTEEQWESVFTNLREKFGAEDEFWIIDPQYVNETEPLKASISENLADIYQDMKDISLLYQKNTLAARENALADCKELFAKNWGYKITNILTRIHHLLFSGNDDYIESLDIF